jgi:competence protein ComEC
MLLGGRAGMEQDQYSDFQKVGIVHLFSVGGMHVAFLLVVVAWLTSLVRLGARGKFWAGIFILLVYGTMVAWPAPVIRAVIMGILGLLAYYSGRENSLLNALAISGLVMLLISPDNLFNLSFQLTMLASWGLIYLFPLVRERLPYKGWGWDMLLVPLCAEVAVLPLVAYYFNLFTPISLFTNILITYLAGGAVILGFMAFLLAAFLPFLATLLLYPAGLFIEMILLIVQWSKVLPGAYIWVATPAVGMIALYYIAIFIGIIGLKKPSSRRYTISAIVLLMVFIICLLLPASCYDRGNLQIAFIDVGQGDSLLLKSPQGKFILVDGGGSEFYDVAATKLLPYLHYRGIRHLDMIINTHPDIDHEKGLESAADQLDVNCLGLPASISTSKKYQPLRDIAVRRNIPILNLAEGQSINLEEGMEIKVLHPERDLYDGQELNQESVVLEVRYGEFSALLTGDIPSETMSQVLEKVDLPITVIKVPHHGSSGSLPPGFYQELHPNLAVISVGANNPFGHPTPSVLEALAQANVKVLRTDQDGLVMMRTDGQDLTVSSYKGVKGTGP